TAPRYTPPLSRRYCSLVARRRRAVPRLDALGSGLRGRPGGGRCGILDALRAHRQTHLTRAIQHVRATHPTGEGDRLPRRHHGLSQTRHLHADRLSPGKIVVIQLNIDRPRSEEHTSELQSRENLVGRLLLEKKK